MIKEKELREIGEDAELAKIKKSYQKLEEKIKTRTQELEKRNKELEDSRIALLNILEDTNIAKSRIEEGERKTQAIITNLTDGLLVFDNDNKISLINPRAEEFFKIKGKDLIGMTVKELSELEELRPLTKSLGIIVGEGRREELIVNKGLVLEAFNVSMLKDKKKSGNLVILHDITREKRIEKMKSEFVSIAAHQLRTPLSIIKWSLSMMIEGDLGSLNSEQKEILLKTNQTNERMIHLINDLLNVARIEEGRIIYQPKVVDFKELIKGVVVSLESVAKEKKIELKIKETKGPKIVKADIEKLFLAVKNLIENAIYYSNPNSVVTLSCERKDRWLEFSVQDTGIGISKDQQDHIFVKFFRGNNAVKKETEGTGLGLFITKNIIKAHGGKVWFESVQNKGTTFFFSLPIIG